MNAKKEDEKRNMTACVPVFFFFFFTGRQNAFIQVHMPKTLDEVRGAFMYIYINIYRGFSETISLYKSLCRIISNLQQLRTACDKKNNN